MKYASGSTKTKSYGSYSSGSGSATLLFTIDGSVDMAIPEAIARKLVYKAKLRGFASEFESYRCDERRFKIINF